MDLSQLAALLQDLGDNTELTERIKSVISQSEATDLLQHFHLDAVISDECTTHIEYKVAQGLVPRKIEKRWYRREEPIGRGSYGQVWLEQEGKASNQRAVKIMEKVLMTRHGIDFKKEILALAKFSKPQYQQQEVLVKFLGWCEQPSNLFLYMEYFELGDLEGHITGSITEDDIKDISTNLLNGLRIMHREGFAHRDLKPGNIFVVQKPPAARWWVKIGDFGISKRVNHELTALYTSIGTPLYMAPEITGDLDTDEPTSKYNNAVDMWSLGCVVYKVATQAVPFPARRDLRRFCIGGPFPEQPLLDRITADGTEFVKRLLVPDPRDRLSAESALQTSWLSQRRRQSEDSILVRAETSSDPKKPARSWFWDRVFAKSALQTPSLSQKRRQSEESIQIRAQTSSDPKEPAGSTADNDTGSSEATARISTSLLVAQPENPGPRETRVARRSSAYQIQQHLVTSTNGMPRPPTEISPSPSHVPDIVDRGSDPAEATIRLSAPGSRRPAEPSRPQSPRSPQPDNQVDLVQKAVTDTLLATKQLLNKLTEWSRKEATEGDVSGAWMRCGYNFNMACRRFNNVGIKTTDIASFTPSLRTVLETTLSQDASPQALDLYLPRIRAIVIDMLHGMKQKQSLLRGEAQEVPAGTREPPVTTAEGSHLMSAAQATIAKTPEDYLKRPRDDRELDQLFLELIEKRGWNKLPAQAQRQMLAYTAEKKWTLVYQDRLTELQGKTKKFESSQILDRIEEEGSPEWFVKKIRDGTVSTKQLESLHVSLQTQPLRWVNAFVELHGLLALTNVLSSIHNKSSSQSATGSIRDTRDLDNELRIVKCVEWLMNTKSGANNALAHQQIVISLTNSLVSPELNTRKTVTEILTFLGHWGERQGYQKVLDAMDIVKDQHHKAGRFDFWIPAFEVAIDTHMQARGSDRKLDRSQVTETLLREYCYSTTCLINMLVSARRDDLKFRCHIRAQLNACGIQRILPKLERFEYGAIDRQIERFRDDEAIDYEDLVQRE